MHRRSVAIVVFEDVQGLDVLGPADVFSFAGYVLGDRSAYEVELVGDAVGPITTASGPRLVVDRPMVDPDLRPDVLLVAGGETVERTADDPMFTDALRALADRSGELGSICSGAILMAETGLLDGRRATTHWAMADHLRRRRPAVKVESNPIFLCDGIWSSAGVTAGIDLALEFVRRHHGSEVASATAKHLVVYLQRAGGQDQFSAHLSPTSVTNATIADLLAYIVDHPEQDLTVSDLAQRVHMSERGLQRAFARETGGSLGRYVERARIDHARRLLEHGDGGLAGVAAACGYGRVETFIRAFSRVVGITPDEYRDRFRRPPKPASDEG